MTRSISKKEFLFIILGGIFVSNAIIGELIGGKLIIIGPFTMSIGVIPWPIVFLTTDLINEYYGKSGVRRLTFLTVLLILYTFVIIFFAIAIPSASFSPVTDEQFKIVFGQSMWIIIGSITAFLASQLIDVIIFWIFRHRTKGRMLWLRATGSTAVSQLIDSFIIIAIAFWLPGKLNFTEYLSISSTNYSYKLIIAIALTPFIYLGHKLIEKYLGEKSAKELIVRAVEESN